MQKIELKRHRLPQRLVATALVLTGTIGSAYAQMGNRVTQGFERTGQDPARYAPEEKEAVSLINRWFATTNVRDTPAHMALVSDNMAYRGDPLEPLRFSAQGYCLNNFFVAAAQSRLLLDEVYVVGGPQDTVMLTMRRDINAPYGSGMASLGGYPVPVASMMRMHNGKIVEWYDFPVNRVSMGAEENPPTLGADFPVSERCKPYPDGGKEPAPRASVPSVTIDAVPTYGTHKPDFYMNPFELRALAAVRGFFASRELGDPLLLASFVDNKAAYRPSPQDGVKKGREGFMKEICGYLGTSLDINALYVVGGDYDSGVLVDWSAKNPGGSVTHMASLFRVNGDGHIVEWMDSAVDGPSPASRKNPNAEACKTVQTAFTPPPARRVGGGGFGGAPGGAGPGSPGAPGRAGGPPPAQ